MSSLHKNIRFYILCFSILLSLLEFIIVITSFSGNRLQTIRLTQTYGLTAILYLYFALLAGPFCYTFRSFPYRGQYLKARRAIGVSTFYFAFLHAHNAFFGQFGGFAGLSFLDGKYVLALSLSFIALCILFIQTITSVDKVIQIMKFRRWKLLHRFIYLAGIFVLIHAIMLGTHFQTLNTSIPRILFLALTFLLSLEILRIDAWIRKKFQLIPLTSYAILPLFILLGFLLFPLVSSGTENLPSLGVHSQHIEQAREAQQTGNQYQTTNQYTGLNGDKTKRYTVSFNNPKDVQPNEETVLEFTVYDAASGHKVEAFHLLHERLMHLIIVDSSVNNFTHLHPEFKNGVFTITTSFPHTDLYHLYLDFQPIGGIEQQIALTLPVGTQEEAAGKANIDTKYTKKIDSYEVTLNTYKNLQAEKMAIGEQQMSFTIKDATTEKPITTLKPYLGAYGHLVMINVKTFDYIHVHPVLLTTSAIQTSSGPTVDFMPLGLYGPIKPGMYRLFVEFNPDNHHITTDFTVNIQ